MDYTVVIEPADDTVECVTLNPEYTAMKLASFVEILRG